MLNNLQGKNLFFFFFSQAMKSACKFGTTKTLKIIILLAKISKRLYNWKNKEILRASHFSGLLWIPHIFQLYRIHATFRGNNFIK